jgi:hypothetical protein
MFHDMSRHDPIRRSADSGVPYSQSRSSGLLGVAVIFSDRAITSTPVLPSQGRALTADELNRVDKLAHVGTSTNGSTSASTHI